MSSKRDSQRMYAAIRDLERQTPSKGLGKIAIALSSLFGSVWLAMTTDNPGLFALFSTLSAVIYAYALIPTHDAIHYTLTGIRWVDELYARAVSYPIFWTHGTYSKLHKVHHRMNGLYSRDPERKNPTEHEYFHPNPLLRFYYRHRFALDTFLLGGTGLIFTNIIDGFRFGHKTKSIRRALYFDLTAIVTTHALITLALMPYELVGQFYLLFFIWERIAGAILQFRAHIEHDSLEPSGQNYYEIQMSASRNIMTSEIVSRYFNRLTFHSMHHAFPKIPFYNLAEAHRRIKELCTSSLLPEQPGYLAATLYSLKHKNYYIIGEGDKIESVEWLDSA